MARLTEARLIDYHINDTHGGDIHIAAWIDQHAHLHVAAQPAGQPGTVQRVDLSNSVLIDALRSVALNDGTLHTDAVKQGSGHDPDTVSALDRAHVIITELTAAATWLVEQAEAGEGIDIAEVRTRFGLTDTTLCTCTDDGNTPCAEHDEATDPNATPQPQQPDEPTPAQEPAKPATGHTAPARPRPRR